MMELTRVILLLLVLQRSVASDIFDLPCTSDPECSDVEGATCNTDVGSCYCPGYFIIDPNMQRCLPVASGAGSDCEVDAQCSAAMLSGGACLNGKCGCVAGKHYHAGFCWDTRVVGEQCTQNEQCKSLHAPDAVECIDGLCACAEGFYMREYTDCRKITTEIGGPCAVNLDCHINDSFCNFATLQCESLTKNMTGAKRITNPGLIKETTNKIGVIISPKSSRKIKNIFTRELGEECQIAEDCAMANAMCTPSGYCACKRGFFLQDQACYPEIGGPCSSPLDCTIVESTCTNNMCTCNIGYGASANRFTCLKQINQIKRACTEQSQCLLFGPRSICKDQGSKLCDCGTDSRHVTADNFCWVIKSPGEICSDLRDCHVPDTTNPVSCKDGRCTCFEGYHPSADSKNCHIDAPELGNKCTETTDCEVVNSMCTNAKCQCKSGYYESLGQCLTGVGGSCVDQTDCTGVDMSVCSSSKCQCPAGYVSNLAISACLPVGDGIGAECQEAQQCSAALGPNVACSDGACDCAKKHHLALGQCIPSKGLGESCERSVECWLSGGMDGLVCRNYVCTCDFDFQPSPENDKCINSGSLSLPSSLFLVTLLLMFLTK